jgi:hypothetical protein
VGDCYAFLRSGWAAKAADRGWTAPDLFAFPGQWDSVVDCHAVVARDRYLTDMRGRGLFDAAALIIDGGVLTIDGGLLTISFTTIGILPRVLAPRAPWAGRGQLPESRRSRPRR